MAIKQAVKSIIGRIKSSGFLKSVLSLSSGVVVGQAINMVGMPVIGRIYSAADMGDYTLITSRSNVIMAISVLGMMTVFMLPEKDSEARTLSRLVTFSSIIVSLVCVCVLYAVSPWWKLLTAESITYPAALLVLWIYVIITSISNICYAYVNRLRLYRVLFWNPVIGASVNIGLGIGFGLLKWGFIGYTLAHILSMCVNIVHLVSHANPYSAIPKNEKQNYIQLLKSYQRFPKYQMPANLISTVSVQIPLEIITFAFSSAVLGYYSMANRIMSIPIMVLATPINRVYYQEANRRHQRGENIAEFAFKIMESNIKIAIVPIVILMIFGRWIFTFVLGAQWAEAGSYAAMLGIYFLVMFCVSCLSGSFVIIGKNSWNLVFSTINVALGVMLFAIVKLFPGIPAWAFLFIMSLLFTTERVVEEGIFFVHMGLKPGKYIGFVLKFIMIPFVSAFIIQFMLNRIV